MTSAKRYDHSLSFVMMDIDYFKSVNDEHGHAMGDEVLKAAAASLVETARKSDHVCRYGGEEFCVLLPQVDLDQATVAAERFRAAIEQLDIQGLRVTASFGVSTLASDCEIDSMIDAADKCLYVAKRNGRNQVVRCDDTDLHSTESGSDATCSTPDEASTAQAYEDISEAEILQLLSSIQDQNENEKTLRVGKLCNALSRLVEGQTIDLPRTRPCFVIRDS